MDKIQLESEKEKKKEFIENKKQIRKSIISSSFVFSKKLSGKYVLYVFDDNTYIEVFFRKNSFSHLTGVKTNLNAFDFYDKAVSGKLAFNQFTFDKKSHPYDLAKKKTSRLGEIDKFITNDLIVVKEIKTDSQVYKFGLTDTDLTLCLSENLDKKTKIKIDDYFIPASFRVGDDSISKSKDSCFVKWIFTKRHKHTSYNTLCYGNIDEQYDIPIDILSKIDSVKVFGKENTA